MMFKVAVLMATAALMPSIPSIMGDPIIPNLSDPDLQTTFFESAPNALDIVYDTSGTDCDASPFEVVVDDDDHFTGLTESDGITPARTQIYGYGIPGYEVVTWPGFTFEETQGVPRCVKWMNNLAGPHLIKGLNGVPVVDETLHWAFSLKGYEENSILMDGVPIVTHLHGGFSNSPFDGNPEFFFTKDFAVTGPQFVSKTYEYYNEQPAGTLWYHDHALGLTRLNVYAGLAGFYILRDEVDTGEASNLCNLPSRPHEAAFAIQDRMFKDNGELFYPAFEGDPYYADFITGEGAVLPPEDFPENGGPTALAEFFGDHMLVNGKIWPKFDVDEPGYYRLRFLNGCDSRFLVVKFFETELGSTTLLGVEPLVPFNVIGVDQGFRKGGTQGQITSLVFEPGARYDIIIDFANHLGKRIIMWNEGGDEPFGGLPVPPEAFLYEKMKYIMSFDVPEEPRPDNVEPDWQCISQRGKEILGIPGAQPSVDRIRRVALFEGLDDFGRLQPLLGTIDKATDETGSPIYWPDDCSSCTDPDDPCADTSCPYCCAGLAGLQMQGTMGWHEPITEYIWLGDTEEWEIWNLSGDAHPIHLHLVSFEVMERRQVKADLVEQPTVQHSGKIGQGFRVEKPRMVGPRITELPGYVENGPKDVVVALPGQMTKIKATFEKPGRYVWHCHILSHEDHEMMRVFQVVE